MQIRITPSLFGDSIKGRVTKPSKPLSDSAFRYVRADWTNLAETNRRALERLTERTVVRVGCPI